jgi:DNA polymerase I-like protein with 3'-5' exonuclease and polymerase domains
MAELRVDYLLKKLIVEAHGVPRKFARIVLVLHDEILVQVPKRFAKLAKRIVESSLVAAGKFFFPDVPITAGVSIGASWADAK